MSRVFYMPRTRSTRVLRLLEEIGKPYDAVQIAREDRRSPSPLDPTTTPPERRSDPKRAATTALTQRHKLTAAFTRSDLRASLGAAVVPARLSGAGGSVELASRSPGFVAGRASARRPLLPSLARTAGRHAPAFGRVRAPDCRSGARLLGTRRRSLRDLVARSRQRVKAEAAPVRS